MHDRLVRFFMLVHAMVSSSECDDIAYRYPEPKIEGRADDDC